MKKFIKFIFLVSLFYPPLVFAGEIYFINNSSSVFQGDEFVVSVKLDTKEKIINAIEGNINFPVDLVDIKDIRSGGSVINLWVEKPYSYKFNTIRFAGITPGGFSGPDNLLFAVVLKARSLDVGAIYADNLRSFSNDIESVEINNKSLVVSVLPRSNELLKKSEVLEDKEPPESFTGMVARDSNIFGGKYFLIFYTEDKISGVDFFQVKEGEFGYYKNAKSPYLLQNQNLDKKIFIKAIDRAKNERLEIIEPRNNIKLYPGIKIFAIIFISLFFVIVFGFLKEKFTKNE